LCFYFLENKRKTTYVAAINEMVKIFNAYKLNLKPQRILTDFETALQDCFSVVFKEAEIKGCYFHFNQCIFRKIQALGLVGSYLNNSSFRDWICKFYTLPLIPVDKLHSAFTILSQSLPFRNDAVDKFIQYFIKQWLKGIVSPEVWNHHDSKRRTNNGLEGYHSALNNKFHGNHADIQSYLDNLKIVSINSTHHYLSNSSKVSRKYQSNRQYESDLDIELLHVEYHSGRMTFEDYFEVTII
jgi:hypothetical protein